MIISHKHKFIFIKPQKTAGTSVELLLSRICGPENVITPLGFDPDPNVRERHGAKPPQIYFRPKPFKYWQMCELYWLFLKGKKPNRNYWEHLSAEKINEYVGDDIWKSYKKISIVRNPWDHVISQHNWMLKYRFGGVTDDFEHFIREKYVPLWNIISVNNYVDLDFVIKFENLEENIEELFSDLKVITNSSLPKTKTKSRKVAHYSEAYNNITKNLVEDINCRLIRKFNYKF